MTITSTSNDKVKYFVKLRNIKTIKEDKLFIVEGEHLVKEAISMGIVEELILLDGEKIETDIKKTYVSKQVLNKISLLPSTPNIMAVCRVFENNNELKKVILLDGLQDAGNVGSIIRNAVAFNIDTVVLSTNSVNKYNDKLIRATQGMFFKINVIQRDLNAFIKELKEKDIPIIGTSLQATKELKTLPKLDKYAICFGNEGQGMSKEIEESCDELIYINMNEDCESLNVACSSSILLYHMEG